MSSIRPAPGAVVEVMRASLVVTYAGGLICDHFDDCDGVWMEIRMNNGEIKRVYLDSDLSAEIDESVIEQMAPNQPVLIL